MMCIDFRQINYVTVMKKILSLRLATYLVNSKGQATFIRLAWDQGVTNLGWEVKIYLNDFSN